MDIVIDANSGFCFGVINAIQTAERYLSDHASLYCLGDIVHNSDEVKRLAGIGLRVITYGQFASLHDTVVLIRAHGEPPETYAFARGRNIRLIDATCPVVLRLQQRIADFRQNPANREAQILIFGKKGHAEVVGLMGRTGGNGLVLSSVGEIGRIDCSRPAMLYSQTTRSVEDYKGLVEAIQRRYEEAGRPELFRYSDTICRKVANRARQVAEFARQHDIVVFVSGAKSSNGLYLYNVCRQNNPRSHLVSDIRQLDVLDFRGAESVGICGATSTPMWLMEKMACRIGGG